MEFEFVKMHGCAADGILIDCTRGGAPAHVAAANAPWMCSRRTGVGADFVVLVYDDARAEARIDAFGPEGRGMPGCADAARFAAEYLFRRRRAGGVARIATPYGLMTAVRNAYGVVTVELGAPQFEAEQIPISGRRGRILDTLVEAGGEACLVSCVGVSGAPHCVMFRHTGGIDLNELGLRCRKSSFFYGGEGVTLAEPLDEKRLRARVWRYRMGELPASSECAAAAVAAAVRTKRCRAGADVAVEMPGGVLTVREADGRLFVTGEVVEVFSGTVTLGDA